MKAPVVYIVVTSVAFGGTYSLCFTDKGSAAIYNAPEDAELFACQQRDRHPGVQYRVVTCPVL